MNLTTVKPGVAFQYSHTIGGRTHFGAGFMSPVDLARGEGDLMYVLNHGSEIRPAGKRVTVCTVGEDYIVDFARGVQTIADATPSSADGSLIWPTAIALDKEENVYVADEWLNRISIFTKDGNWISKWQEKPGDGDGEINRPSGLAFDANEDLYLVDSMNHRVQKFTKDGKFLAKWGRQGSGDGEFNLPWGITIDGNGDVYVADWRNDRIQKFSPDGEFLMKFGSSGSGDGEFDRPTSVAVDKDGLIYVTDWKNNRLEVFDADGSFITKITGDATISKWGKDKVDGNPEMWHGREIAQGLEREKVFWAPTAVKVDDEGRVFVVEGPRGRIQIYRKIPPVWVTGTLLGG